MQKYIELFDNSVENGQLYSLPSETAAVINYPEFTFHKDEQTIFGLTGYFQKFIIKFFIFAQPLSNLLKKNVDFYFGEEQKLAFNELKGTLSSKTILSIYNQRVKRTSQ